MISAKGVRCRGWTDGMIRRLLGEPDKLAPNPYYRRASPMRLYAVERVEAAEAAEEFGACLEAAQARSRAGRRAASTQYANAVRHAGEVDIGFDFPATISDVRRLVGPDRDVRRMVNFLRHECTTYDGLWPARYGLVGSSIYHHIIKGRVLEVIAERFPDLAKECRRQRGRQPPVPEYAAGRRGE